MKSRNLAPQPCVTPLVDDNILIMERAQRCQRSADQVKSIAAQVRVTPEADN